MIFVCFNSLLILPSADNAGCQKLEFDELASAPLDCMLRALEIFRKVLSISVEKYPELNVAMVDRLIRRLADTVSGKRYEKVAPMLADILLSSVRIKLNNIDDAATQARIQNDFQSLAKCVHVYKLEQASSHAFSL